MIERESVAECVKELDRDKVGVRDSESDKVVVNEGVIEMEGDRDPDSVMD